MQENVNPPKCDVCLNILNSVDGDVIYTEGAAKCPYCNCMYRIIPRFDREPLINQSLFDENGNLIDINPDLSSN